MTPLTPAQKYAVIEQFVSYLLEGRLDHLFVSDLYRILLQGFSDEWEVKDLDWDKIKFLIRSLQQKSTQPFDLFWGMLDFISESQAFSLKNLGIIVDLEKVESQQNASESPQIQKIDHATIQDELGHIYFYPHSLWCEEENAGQRWQTAGFYISFIFTKDNLWFKYAYPQKNSPEEIGLTETRLMTEGSKFKIYPGMVTDNPEKTWLLSAYNLVMSRGKTDPRYIYVYQAGKLSRYHFDENARQIPSQMIWNEEAKQWREPKAGADNDFEQLAHEYTMEIKASDLYRPVSSDKKWRGLFDDYASQMTTWELLLLKTVISFRSFLESYKKLCSDVECGAVQIDTALNQLADLKRVELQKIFAYDLLALDRNAAIENIKLLLGRIASDIQHADIITKSKLSDLHNQLLSQKLELENQIQLIKNLKLPMLKPSAQPPSESATDSDLEESSIEEESAESDFPVEVTADDVPLQPQLEPTYGRFFTINPTYENNQSCRDRVQICIKNATGFIEATIEFGIKELMDDSLNVLTSGEKFVARSGYCYTLKLDQKETGHTITAELEATADSENEVDNNNSEEDEEYIQQRKMLTMIDILSDVASKSTNFVHIYGANLHMVAAGIVLMEIFNKDNNVFSEFATINVQWNKISSKPPKNAIPSEIYAEAESFVTTHVKNNVATFAALLRRTEQFQQVHMRTSSTSHHP